ncbi:MAG: Type IV secretion system protein virB4 [Legionellaceae bacterium]
MLFPPLKFISQLKNETMAFSKIPYDIHLSKYTLRTFDREYIQVIKLEGIDFETIDDEEINNFHNRLNNLLKSIASPQIAIWQHLIRYKENNYPQGNFTNVFSQQLDEKYKKRIVNEKFMVNKLFLTIVYKPTMFKKKIPLFNLLKINEDSLNKEIQSSLDKMEKIISEILSSLMHYEPIRLGIYEHQGIYFSEPIEFFAFLVNGEKQRIPLSLHSFNKTMITSRPFFGIETIELRTSTKNYYGAMLGIKAYPPETHPGLLNELLISPFSFILTQSFIFLPKEVTKNALKRHRNRMQNIGDESFSQINEIDNALDDLQSNRFVMGEHHFSLFLQSESLDTLLDNLSLARTILNNNGILVAREDLALEAAFWAQLPANFKYRPRKAPISSRNLAGFSSLHNFPLGHRKDNHWGEALTVLMTAAGTPYYFSFHARDTNEVGAGKKDVGHTLIIGPTGSGKTVFITFHLCMLQKMGVTSVLFTKDCDSAICIRALGGKFYTIKSGMPTGWNPFYLEATPHNIQFLNDFVRKLVTRENTLLTASEEADLTKAIYAVMAFEKKDRRLGRVLDYLDPTKTEGIYTRLKQWCYARNEDEQDGIYAWLFDNEIDTLLNSLGEVLTTGFDTTEFLDRPLIRTPINMWLFFITQRLIDGRRFALFIAEFWKALADPYFAEFGKNQLKTIRKNNGFVVLDSQSASDAINHPISRTLIEQTPTKILFPNPEANFNEYTEGGLNLSEREYLLIKEEIPLGSKMFLIKQGRHAIVAKLDLSQFEEELSILSGNKKNNDYIEYLINAYGEKPEIWLPLFKMNRGKV